MKQNTVPRQEHPRPDFQRDCWENLNGWWDFAFDDNNVGETECWQEKEIPTQSRILVPFCYQSKRSGIFDTGIHEFLWYQRDFDLEDSLLDKHILLHFGAVDTVAKVWLNGKYLGSHCGGYTPFYFNISNVVQKTGNRLVVKAEDKFECSKPRGKQYWDKDPDRCWYTATSGIWQTVWLEAVPDIYLERIRLTPDIDRRCVEGEFYFSNLTEHLSLKLDVFYRGKRVRTVQSSIERRICKLTVDVQEEDFVDEIHYWTPETPNLYELKITVFQNGEISDQVNSYFGMRKISVSGRSILLNNKPYYQKLVLDQGYWPDSLLTPPSDEAIQADVLAAKELGFNGARKHQKIEDPRYYYWADRLGLLVWGEMPSGYAFDMEEVETITHEWLGFLERDYNHPCIIAWVPLNESWGVRNIYTDSRQQAFALALYHLTKAADSMRLVSTNDGWEQVYSDLCGIHDYAGTGVSFQTRYAELGKLLSKDAQGRMLYAQGHTYTDEPIMLTEYGGIAFENADNKNWGYNSPAKTDAEFLNRFESITHTIQQIPDVCGYCYTQLTDVEQEINGLMTADRRMKIDPKKIREINCHR